jgi:hypothetical protein
MDCVSCVAAFSADASVTRAHENGRIPEGCSRRLTQQDDVFDQRA